MFSPRDKLIAGQLVNSLVASEEKFRTGLLLLCVGLVLNKSPEKEASQQRLGIR